MLLQRVPEAMMLIEEHQWRNDVFAFGKEPLLAWPLAAALRPNFLQIMIQVRPKVTFV